jgi:hypothetical protein
VLILSSSGNDEDFAVSVRNWVNSYLWFYGHPHIIFTYTYTNMCVFYYFLVELFFLLTLLWWNIGYEEKRICILMVCFTESDERTKTACLLIIQISDLPCYFLPLRVFYYLIANVRSKLFFWEERGRERVAWSDTKKRNKVKATIDKTWL